jgi:hypothetical protein
MEVLNRLFAVLGQLLLWVSSVLVIEELTLGGLARLLLSMPFDSRRWRRRKMGDAASPDSAKSFLEVDNKNV